ncbi:uncharacterized protein LOC143903162 [Temnothorax americanus]|uniref:uncharacterized protein LOC143903162 n=1 Tax=Temnothorax americanus TaxID=1964332 RepID=UPI00406841E3
MKVMKIRQKWGSLNLLHRRTLFFQHLLSRLELEKQRIPGKPVMVQHPIWLPQLVKGKGYNLPSTESQSTNAQTKDKGLDFGSITSDITKSQMSSTISLTPSPRGALKTMIALPKKLSFNVSQPDSSNCKKQLNRGSKTSVNVSKTNINTKKKQFSQGKDRSDKATTDKSQRPILEIVDINKEVENSNSLASSLLESGKNLSNSILNALLTNEKNEMTFTMILRRWTLKQQAPYEDMTLPLTLFARMTLKIQIILMNHIQIMIQLAAKVLMIVLMRCESANRQ